MIKVLISKKLSRAAEERNWGAFLAIGSVHSRMAITLPQIINMCEERGQPYILKAQPGVGYYIEPLKMSEL